MKIKKKRKNKKRVKIPKYSLTEELINSITHGLGAIFAIVVLVLTIVEASSKGSIFVVSATIYGITMIIMYVMSSLYHALSPKIKAKRILRIIDHCDIYLFIAGCYTPISIALIGGIKGWLIFTISWSTAILGVLINAINLEKYQKFSTILYLLMGWMIMFSIDTLTKIINPLGITLLISGGISYSIGALFYTIGSKIKYMHCLFHFFVLLGSILHFIFIYSFVL